MSEKYTNRGSTVYENDEDLSTIDVVDLLNEQQATISALKEENEQLRKKLERIYGFKGLNCRCVR